MTSITDQKNVQELIKKFDLVVEKSYRLVAEEYKITPSGVTISKIAAYDTDWKFVKYVDFSKLQPEDFTLIFREKK